MVLSGFRFNRPFSKTLPISFTLLSMLALCQASWGQDNMMSQADMSAGENVNTGIISGSDAGEVPIQDGAAMDSDGTPASGSSSNGNMRADNTGVAINGSEVKDSNINNNENNLSTGNNTNTNVISPRNDNIVAPTMLSPAYSSGGNAVMMLPRNPLPMPNAMVGRSNFGLQFGLQNNPILGSLGGGNGRSNALGWFMQAGLTIPFGKIPSVFKNNDSRFDDLRRAGLENQRNVLGRLSPQEPAPRLQYQKEVKGKITGMGAYNYGTLPSAKLALPQLDAAVADIKVPQPKLIALSGADVFTKPLNYGDPVGAVEPGTEYAYLGHTNSGWVKILLPNGKTGWTSTEFEYMKNDFTQIDNLAVDPSAKKDQRVGEALKTLPKKPTTSSANPEKVSLVKHENTNRQK